MLLLVGLFVARPLLQAEIAPRRARSERQRLLAQKEAALAQISVLEFDYETGKLPAEVYEQQRAAKIGEAAVVLEQLDQASRNPGIDAEIEAAVARLRGQAVAAAPGAAAPGVMTPAGQTARFCSQCGAAVDSEDKFCAHCGHKLHDGWGKPTEKSTAKTSEPSVDLPNPL